MCPSFTEGDAASAPAVTPEPWAPATWLSGDDHGWTCTSSPTMPFKAHHAVVRPCPDQLDTVLLESAAGFYSKRRSLQSLHTLPRRRTSA